MPVSLQFRVFGFDLLQDGDVGVTSFHGARIRVAHRSLGTFDG